MGQAHYYSSTLRLTSKSYDRIESIWNPILKLIKYKLHNEKVITLQKWKAELVFINVIGFGNFSYTKQNKNLTDVVPSNLGLNDTTRVLLLPQWALWEWRVRRGNCLSCWARCRRRTTQLGNCARAWWNVRRSKSARAPGDVPAIRRSCCKARPPHATTALPMQTLRSLPQSPFQTAPVAFGINTRRLESIRNRLKLNVCTWNFDFFISPETGLLFRGNQISGSHYRCSSEDKVTPELHLTEGKSCESSTTSSPSLNESLNKHMPASGLGWYPCHILFYL